MGHLRIHTLFNYQHCSQDPDAIHMHQLCQIKSPHLQKRLAWESSSSTQERILHKISTSRQQLQTVSVVMAEAPAMALAAAVTESLHFHNINFLSDNQELVNFFNNRDRSTPPDWRIKHLTQNFINSTMQRNTSVFKIRSQNQTAHTLAKQAFVGIQSQPTSLSFSCSNRSHVLQCPLRDALTSVVTDSVTILSASCC